MIMANHWVARKIADVFPAFSLLRLHPPPKKVTGGKIIYSLVTLILIVTFLTKVTSCKQCLGKISTKNCKKTFFIPKTQI